jgi:transposase
MKSKRPRRSLLKRLNPDAAGIDCGSTMHYVAVRPDRDVQPVRSFRTYTADLNRLADWLVGCGVKTVAMEATGVYWIPVFEILEARGLEVLLVNAYHVRNVPGRKSDVVDAEWLRQLHSFGLMRGSFRPSAEIARLRTYMRHRQLLIEAVSVTINRIQKALIQMNLHLHVVLSDVMGSTGAKIVRAIVTGETEAARLAQHRDPHCRASEEEIAEALTGHYTPEHVFELRQHLEAFDFHQRQIQGCDFEIERYLKELGKKSGAPPSPRVKGRRRGRGRHEPAFEVRPLLQQLTHADLSQIDGIGPYNALRLVAEIGTDMSRWRTEKHFTSWLTLAPNNKISGGRLLSSHTRTSTNRAAAILRGAAVSLARGQTALGAFYRRLAYRVGKAVAVTATARKLAVLVYRTLKGEIQYQDPGATTYDRIRRETELKNIRKRASSLGFGLINTVTGEILEGVS